MSDSDNTSILVQAIADNDCETAKAVLLWEAAKAGDLERVEQLIEQGASPSHVVPGEGSTLDVLINTVTKLRYAAWKLLSHQKAGEVLNGTSETWPPFALAVARGDTGLAYSMMGQDNFDFSEIPWQFKFVIEESNNFSMLDEIILSANGLDDVRALVVDYFERRASAGL